MRDELLVRPEWTQARDLLLAHVSPVAAERVPLWDSIGRVLGQELTAAADVPAFDRSPYDGYALRAADVQGASADSPVTLRVLEEVPAGSAPTQAVTAGTATKILTGAPIPLGADAVVMYEHTVYTEDSVTLFAPMHSGQNIIRRGEDVHRGQLLAPRGLIVDAGLAGSLAAQGIAQPLLYRQPIAGILSTGNEVVPVGALLREGQIYDTNLYLLKALLCRAGFAVRSLGHADDRVEDIAAHIEAGLADCDVVVTTGGVSAGDYDLTPAAMERAGVKLLIRGVRMKPGMACAYGLCAGKLVCGLSGNPASSAANFSAVLLPALRRLCGLRTPEHVFFPVELADDFPKASPSVRFLRGTLALEKGIARMHIRAAQGNAVISSLIECSLLALVPASSGPLAAGTRLDAFFA